MKFFSAIFKTLFITATFLSLTGNTLAFDQCDLILGQAKNQATQATSNLASVIEQFEKASTYFEEDKKARALIHINSSEASLYQARNYYVLALFRLDHAATLCQGPQNVEVDELKSELQIELGELDTYEEKVYTLKDLIIKS